MPLQISITRDRRCDVIQALPAIWPLIQPIVMTRGEAARAVTPLPPPTPGTRHIHLAALSRGKLPGGVLTPAGGGGDFIHPQSTCRPSHFSPSNNTKSILDHMVWLTYDLLTARTNPYVKPTTRVNNYVKMYSIEKKMSRLRRIFCQIYK